MIEVDPKDIEGCGETVGITEAYVGEYRDYVYLSLGYNIGHRAGYVLLNGDPDEESGPLWYASIECHNGITFEGRMAGKTAIGFACGENWDGVDYSLGDENTIFIRSEERLNHVPKSKWFVEDECCKIIDQLIEVLGYDD